MPKIIFVDKSGNEYPIEARVGDSILHVAHENGVDLEGACDGSLACSTCHVIVDPAYFSKLPPATEEEEDMLDLAFGLTHTSRLGCQLIVTDQLDGIKLTLPSASRNIKLEG